MNRVVLAVVAGSVALSASAGAQSDLLVLDWQGPGGGDLVDRFHWPSGKAIDVFAGGPVTPYGDSTDMTLDGKGNLYVAYHGSNLVAKFNGETGEFDSVFTKGSPGGPTGLAFGPDGNLYVSSSFQNNRVLRYDGTTGDLLGVFVSEGLGGLDGPRGLVFDHNGLLCVCSALTNQLIKYNADGSFAGAVDLSAVGLKGPDGVAVGSDGSLYITGRGSDSIAKIDAGGTLSQLVAPGVGAMSGPRKLTIDSDGNLVVPCENGSGVLRFEHNTGIFLGQVVTGTAGGMSGTLYAVAFLPPPPPECIPDMNHDGVLDLFDFLAFFNLFNAGC